MARHVPKAHIARFSSSTSQRVHILYRAAAQRLETVSILTGAMNNFSINETFHRVAWVEIFEHMYDGQQVLG